MNRKERRAQGKKAAVPAALARDGGLLAEALQFHRAGQLIEAEQLYRQILETQPDHPEALHLLGVAVLQRGSAEEAVSLIGKAIAIDGAKAVYHNHLGAALHRSGRMEDSLKACRTALALDPNHADAYANLSLALNEMERFDEGLQASDMAIGLNPSLAAAHCSRGAALHSLGRYEEALAALLHSAALDPHHPDTHHYLGATLHRLGQLEASIVAFQRAVALKPDYPQPHFGLAVSHLLLGKWEVGWREYEWRWHSGSEPPRVFSKPQWQGENLAGRTILLHAEQGLGDTIQFCSYANLVAARGGRVVLAAPRPLTRLLQNLDGVSQVIPLGDPFQPFDVHCALLSLPGVFRTTPGATPPAPYLHPEPDLVETWRARLGGHGFRIGIVWQGSRSAVDRGRSAALAQFAGLASVPGVRLISLQKGYGVEQLEDLPEGMRVETLGEDFDGGPDAFIDTAAVMANLDLVVTVDSAAGAPAGALGRPAWVALQAVPHWAWTDTGDHSPWWPSVRAFRQTDRGDWDGVFQRMTQSLRQRLDDGVDHHPGP